MNKDFVLADSPLPPELLKIAEGVTAAETAPVELQETGAQPVQAPGFLEVLPTAYKQDNAVFNFADYVGTPIFQEEPGFTQKFFENRDKYMQGLPDHYGERLAQSNSEAELAWHIVDIQKREAQEAELQSAGWSGMAARGISLLVSPDMAAGIGAEGALIGATVTKLARLKHGARVAQSIAGGTLSAPLATYQTAIERAAHSKGTKDVEDLTYNLALGVVLAGGLTAALAPGAKPVLAAADDALPTPGAAPDAAPAPAAAPVASGEADPLAAFRAPAGAPARAEEVLSIVPAGKGKWEIHSNLDGKLETIKTKKAAQAIVDEHNNAVKAAPSELTQKLLRINKGSIEDSIPVSTFASEGPLGAGYASTSAPRRGAIPNISKQEAADAWAQVKDAMRSVDPDSDRYMQLSIQEEMYRDIMSGAKTFAEFNPIEDDVFRAAEEAAIAARGVTDDISGTVKTVEFDPTADEIDGLVDGWANTFAREGDLATEAELTAARTGVAQSIVDDMDDALLHSTPDYTPPAEAFAISPSESGMDLVARATAWAKKINFSGIVAGGKNRLLHAIRVSDSAVMLNMKSDVFKYIGFHITENGTGLFGRTKTAASLSRKSVPEILAKGKPSLRESWAAFTTENKIPYLSKRYWGSAREQWNKELYAEIHRRRRAFLAGGEHTSTVAKHFQNAADGVQDMMSSSLKMLKGAGVRGMDAVAEIPGYVPLRWMGSRFLKFAGTKEELIDLVRLGYKSSMPGISDADSLALAKALHRRITSKALGLDANPGQLLSHDSREFLQDALKADGMDELDIDMLMARIDNTLADRGRASFAKGRTEIDLLVTDAKGRSLMDLVDTDMETLTARYVTEASGRSALARHGIPDQAAWTNLRNTALLDAQRAGDTPAEIETALKALDATYNHLIGQPVGTGVNRHARRLMEGAQLTTLGKMMFGQAAESSNIVAAHGLMTVLKTVPTVRAFRQTLLSGRAPKGVMGELAPLMGGLSDETRLFRAAVRLNEHTVDDPEWLRILDNVQAASTEMLGRVSLLNWIQTAQRQFIVPMQANKVAQLLKSADRSPEVLARFADVGWDAKFIARLDKQFKHFEFNGNTLDKLNLDKWSDQELVEDFVVGLQRHSDFLVQRKQIGQDAYWMHQTTGALLTQLRTFPIVAIENQMARGIKMADGEATLGMVYGLGLSSLVVMAKAHASSIGRSDRKEYLEKHMSTEALLKGAFQYWGQAAVFPDLVNIAAGAGVLPAELAFNEIGNSGAGRNAKLSLSDIPAAGFAQNVFNAGAGVVKASLYKDYKYSKEDARASAGALALGNTLPATLLFNYMQRDLPDRSKQQ